MDHLVTHQLLSIFVLTIMDPSYDKMYLYYIVGTHLTMCNFAQNQKL